MKWEPENMLIAEILEANGGLDGARLKWIGRTGDRLLMRFLDGQFVEVRPGEEIPLPGKRPVSDARSEPEIRIDREKIRAIKEAVSELIAPEEDRKTAVLQKIARHAKELRNQWLTIVGPHHPMSEPLKKLFATVEELEACEVAERKVGEEDAYGIDCRDGKCEM